MKPTLSRIGCGFRVGADFFARRSALKSLAGQVPRGLVDRLDDLANPGIDVARVHPAIAVFFENTAELELHIRSRWRFPFSIVWRLFRPVLKWIGQFVLPIREGRILTRIVALDPSRDGRSDVRGVIREYTDTGTIMQVVAYATWENAGARYMSAAFPLPGGHLTGILRLDANGEDASGRLAVALTSEPKDGDDAGIWYVLGSFAMRVPFGERIRLWAADTDGAPAEIERDYFEGATILGEHQQRFLGIRLVTHHYWFRPLSPRPDRAPPSKT